LSQILKPKKGYKSVPWLFGKEIKIPEEWEVKKCSKILELKHGYQFRDEDFIEGKKGIKIIKIGNLKQNGSIDSNNCDIISLDRKSDFLNIVINSGDVLMALTGATLGKIIQVPKINEILLQNYRVGNFFPKNDIDKNFLYCVLKNIFTQKQIWFLVNSGAQPNIGKEDFDKIKIICPPLSEQKQIAIILSNIDNLIESTDKVIENSKRVKTGLMQKLLIRGIGHTKFKKVPWLFGKEIEIPEEWESIILQNISEHITKGTTPTTDGGKFMKKGILFIKVESIDNVGNIQIEKCKFIDIETHEQLLRSQLVENDILFSIAGTLGRVGLIKKDQTPSNTNQAISIIRLKNQKFNLFYLFIFLRSIFIKKQIQRLETVGAQPNLSLTQVNNFQLFSPPLPEQQKIATILSNIDDKIISQVQYKEKLLLLKKSLMQKLLTGEVRV